MCSKALTSGASYTPIGCYKNGTRVFPIGPIGDHNSMTLNEFKQLCSGLNTIYVGLEYAEQCWCGKYSCGKYGTSNGCTMNCEGGGSDCGGIFANCVYQLKAVNQATLF